MKNRTFVKLAVAGVTAVLLQGAVLAQVPTKHVGHVSATQHPAHRGVFSFLHKPKAQPVYGGPGQHWNGSPVRHHSLPTHIVGTGQFIGNKHTKVFHLPGDKGTLPSEQNRVYFKSAAAAQAAGYHQAR